MTAPLRVLLVEDSPSDAALVTRALRGTGRPVEIVRVEDAAAMRAALAERPWDIVLSDWSLPGFGALGALGVLKSTGCDLPFIIVSGTIGEETAVDAMRAGADDYVLKDRLARLAPAVEREVREFAERAARRSAEAALRATEARFRAMIEKSEEGIALSSPAGVTLYLSPAGRRILDREADDALGGASFERMHPDDFESSMATMAQLAQRPGESATMEFRVVRPDGTVRWIEGTGTNRLDDPAVGAIIGNFRDVSERKAALEALRASEERYRRIVETTNEGIWMVDAELTTTFVNARMAALLGSTLEEMQHRTPLDFLSTDSRTSFQRIFERLRRGGSDQVEVPFRRADGVVVWTLVEASPVLDEDGTFEGALAMVMDITPRKRAEASLRVSEERFRGLWDSGLILVTISDLAGRIREINDAGLRLLGYTREELVAAGLGWHDVTPPAWREIDDEALAQLRTTGVAPPWEKELVRRDGQCVPILTGAVMLAGDECIAIALDLTERKRAEDALRQTEDQLRQAQKMEAVGRLAGGVAHDFNNVLSVILSLSELALAELAPTEPLYADLDDIRTAGLRAADLTRQLLMFSRQQVIEPRVLDLSDLLANMDKMLRRMLGEDVELVTLPSRPLGRVRADPSSLEQVVMNLVVNARDAMPTGGQLTIETADVDLDEGFAMVHHGVRAGPHVMLAVSDTGVGMDRATMARIFEPFFTTKEKGKGTGLGLSTVFGIVHQSGGSVWAYSEPGLGTVFKIYLPRVDAAADALRLSRAPELRRGTETVLLVEDEDPVRAVARSILRRNGYEVIEARNAGEALLHCERYVGTIHLLLTDVVMPQMSGPELARRLLATRPAMKVLCMSGYTDDSVVRHGVLAAALAYIQKPFTPETLTRRVREVLDAPAA